MAWNFAGLSRNSLISCSSSIASSAPATSANVVFGVSLLTSFALDLPKFITRLPPPCTEFMMKNSRRTTSRIGSRLTSRVTKMFCWLILVSNFWFFESSSSPMRVSRPDGYAEVILSWPSTWLFSVMSRVCSRSLTTTFE